MPCLPAEVSSEDIARVICLSYGRDPNQLTSVMEMCTADNKPVPIWMVYEEQADAILAAYSVSSQARGGEANG
jgi:hypothetical protein